MEINRDFARRSKVSPHRYNTNEKSPYRPNKETRPLQSEINHLLKEFNQNDVSFQQKIDSMAKLYQQSLSQLHDQKQSRGHSSNQSTKSSRGLDKNFSSQKSVESSNYLNSRHFTSSPNKEKVRESLQRIQGTSYDDSKDLRYICKKIFEFYSSLGDRLNTENLKLSKFHRFANDAGLVDKRHNDQVLDPIFYKYSQNHGSINFEQFLLLLLEMAMSHNQGLSKKEAFAQFFHAFIKPLYTKLYSQTDLGESEIIFREPIQRETCKILKSVVTAFAQLHHHYFPSEYQKFSKSEYETKCEHHMQNFLRDFAICPNLLTFGAAHSVLREILNLSHQQIVNSLAKPFELPRNSGSEFTLLKFLVYIVRLAMISGSQMYGENIYDENGKIMQKDMVLVLLQRMEMSRGLANFRENISASNHTSFSVWPKELMENLTMLNQLESKAMESYSNQYSSRKYRAIKELFGLDDQTPSFSNLEAHSSLGRGRASGRTTQRYGTPSPLRSQRATSTHKEEINHAFEENGEILQVIFKTFCSFTGGNETSRVKNMSLLKLFKDAGLVKDISKGDEHNSFLQTQGYSFRNTGTMGEVSFTNTMKKQRLNPSELDTFLREQFYLNAAKNSPSRSADRHASPEKTSPRPRTVREKSFFDVFLKAIEFVAYRVYSHMELHEAISHVITQDLASVLEEKKITNMKVNTKTNFKMLCSILDDLSIIDVLGKLKKAVHYFYKAYCRQNNLMTAEEFLSFCRNFKILPNVVSREKLVEIFHTLAPLCPIMNPQSRAQNEEVEGKEHGNIDGVVIDENLFVEAMALSAAKIDLSGFSTHIMDKLVYLVEKITEGASSSVNQRMVQAHELQKSQKDLGEVVNYIKGKYWNQIQKGAGNKKDKVGNFDDIFI